MPKGRLRTMKEFSAPGLLLIESPASKIDFYIAIRKIVRMKKKWLAPNGRTVNPLSLPYDHLAQAIVIIVF